MVQYFDVHTEPVVDGCWRVVAAGEIDIATGDVLLRVATDVMSKMRQEGIEVMEIDLTGVTLLGASGIGVLLAVHDHARDRGIRLRVKGASGLPLQVLEITGTLEQLGGKSATANPARLRRAPR